MMKMLLVLGMVGCGAVRMPDTPLPVPMVDGVPAVEVTAPTNAAAAIGVILDAYAHVAGVDVRAATALRVHWAATMPAGLLGETWHNEASGCSTWIVGDAMFSFPRVLPHELGHCARWVLTGDGDSGHADPTWWGDGGYVDQAHVAESAAGF